MPACASSRRPVMPGNCASNAAPYRSPDLGDVLDRGASDPAIPSWFSGPGLEPVVAGTELVASAARRGPRRARRARRRAGRRTCRPSRRGSRCRRPATSIGRCGAAWTASTYVSAPASWARRTSSATGLIDPTALDAQPNATSLGRPWSAASNASMSSVTSSVRMSTVRTTSPRSARDRCATARRSPRGRGS